MHCGICICYFTAGFSPTVIFGKWRRQSSLMQALGKVSCYSYCSIGYLVDWIYKSMCYVRIIWITSKYFENITDSFFRKCQYWEKKSSMKENVLNHNTKMISIYENMQTLPSEVIGLMTGLVASHHWTKKIRWRKFVLWVPAIFPDQRSWALGRLGRVRRIWLSNSDCLRTLMTKFDNNRW